MTGRSRSAVSTPYQLRAHLRRHGLPLGPNARTGREEALPLSALRTHVHIVGPTGTGKSRLLFWLFQCLTQLSDASVILANPKGDLTSMARDWVIANGLTKRLVLFDTGDPEVVVGYNPLRPNGHPIVTHAKAVREGIRAAWGQANFDITPQLARFLLLALCAVRECGLTLLDAVGLLRAGPSRIREAVLGSLGDPYVHEALEYFHSLREQRQEELVASTLARLEAFVFDPAIRRMLMQPESIDLGAILDERKILLVNLEQYRPLRPDDVRLLGRLLVNDIVSHVFARPKDKRHPVFLLLDEVHTFATEDLCTALSQGRELGLHCVLAHTHLEQLRLEGDNERLLSAVKNDARTKIVFGGNCVQDLKPLVEELFVDQLDPWRVKDELTSLELDPIESSREVVTDLESSGETFTFGVGRSSGGSHSRSHGLSRTVGRNETRGRSSSAGWSRGGQKSRGETETALPDGELMTASQSSSGETDGSFGSESETESWGTSDSSGEHEMDSEAQSWADEESISVGSSSQEGTSRSTVPFYEYEKRRVVSSRTFLTIEEQLTLILQGVKEQQTGCFVLKLPGQPAVFVEAPFIKEPWISGRQRQRALERVHAQAFYCRRDLVEASEIRLPQFSDDRSPQGDPRQEARMESGSRRSGARAVRKSTSRFTW